MEQNGCSGGVAPSVSGELGADDSFDIFQENKSGLGMSDAIEDGREEVSWIAIGVSLSRRREWLTWKTPAE